MTTPSTDERKRAPGDPEPAGYKLPPGKGRPKSASPEPASPPALGPPARAATTAMPLPSGASVHGCTLNAKSIIDEVERILNGTSPTFREQDLVENVRAAGSEGNLPSTIRCQYTEYAGMNRDIGITVQFDTMQPAREIARGSGTASGGSTGTSERERGRSKTNGSSEALEGGYSQGDKGASGKGSAGYTEERGSSSSAKHGGTRESSISADAEIATYETEVVVTIDVTRRLTDVESFWDLFKYGAYASEFAMNGYEHTQSTLTVGTITYSQALKIK